VIRAVRGNPCMLTLFVAHRRDLVRYASRIVGDHASAEDVVQEAYVRLDAAARERLLSEPLAYLYRIVRNQALDTQRRIGRERARVLSAAEVDCEQIVEQRPAPDAQASTDQELRRVSDALEELPERTRIALEMHRFGGCTFREIAAHLGISVGLAHALVVDALEHCRRRLRDG
jgi:RNA polymerase sigma-70 factor (ECF subfamily)